MSNYRPEEYKPFQLFLEKACGIVLGENKHYLVSSRLTRLMRDNKIESLQQLVDQLNQSSSSRLRSQVVEAMTTNETLWFRDVYPFEVLTKIIYPEYKKEGKQSLRIWSAACSSGQEPYSISMATEEYLGLLNILYDPRIRAGMTKEQVKEVSPQILPDVRAPGSPR